MEDAFGDLDAQIAEEDEFLHACDLCEPMEEDTPSSVLPLMASQHDMRDEGDMDIPTWLKFSQGDVAEEGPSAFACTPPPAACDPHSLRVSCSPHSACLGRRCAGWDIGASAQIERQAARYPGELLSSRRCRRPRLRD